MLDTIEFDLLRDLKIKQRAREGDTQRSGAGARIEDSDASTWLGPWQGGHERGEVGWGEVLTPALFVLVARRQPQSLCARGRVWLLEAGRERGLLGRRRHDGRRIILDHGKDTWLDNRQIAVL